MARIRKIVEIDEELCDGCGMCAIACAEGALEIRDGKARLIKESYCDGLGACLSGCPKGAVRVIEREADEFDPEEVEEHFEKKKSEEPQKVKELKPARGCPSSQIEVFAPRAESKSPGELDQVSELSHWPVQIRLVPPNAPFLKGADLLIVADCAPVAYPNFHHRFLGGKTVLLGCPKFDDKEEYVKRFTEIFRTAGVAGVTVVDMEVPCCSALPAIVRKALKDAGKDIPVEEITISTRGEIVNRDRFFNLAD
ncbi:MAG: ATP-binding protein [Syntrophobacteraceae bacterium]